MAQKYVYQLANFALQIKDDATGEYVTMDNLKKFTAPDIEPAIQELSGYSGLMGTLEIADWSQIAAMELGLTFAAYPDRADLLIAPGKIQLKVMWSEQYTDNDGNVAWDTYKIYVTGLAKNIPGGDGERGTATEREFKQAVKTYKLVRNGKVLFDYDPANDTIIFGDRNYGEEIMRATLGD